MKFYFLQGGIGHDAAKTAFNTIALLTVKNEMPIPNMANEV